MNTHHVDPRIRNGRHLPEGGRDGPPRRGLVGAVYLAHQPPGLRAQAGHIAVRSSARKSARFGSERSQAQTLPH